MNKFIEITLMVTGRNRNVVIQLTQQVIEKH